MFIDKKKIGRCRVFAGGAWGRGPRSLGHLQVGTCPSCHPPVMSRDTEPLLHSGFWDLHSSHLPSVGRATSHVGEWVSPPQLFLPHVSEPLGTILPPQATSHPGTTCSDLLQSHHTHTSTAHFRVHHNTSSPKGLPSQSRETRIGRRTSSFM